MSQQIFEDAIWLRIIARSLAYLCLDVTGLRKGDLAAQAEFLENLGLPRRDSANLLGSSEDSLRVLVGRSRLRRKVGNAAKTIKKQTRKPRKRVGARKRQRP